MTLSRCETAVLWLLDARLSNAEIATVLQISPRTVKRHRSTICRKLLVSTRREAIARSRGRVATLSSAGTVW